MGDVDMTGEERGMGRGISLALGWIGRPLAVLVLAMLVTACASSSSTSTDAATADSGAAPAVAMEDGGSAEPAMADEAGDPPLAAPATITAVTVREGAPGDLVEITSDEPLVWTSFRDASGDVVIELPNSRVAELVDDVLAADGLVSTVEIEAVTSGNRPLTRMVIATRGEAEHSLVADGNLLTVGIEPVDGVEGDRMETVATPRAEEEPAPSLAYEPIADDEPAEDDVAAGAAAEPMDSEPMADTAAAAPSEPAPVAPDLDDLGTAQNPRTGPAPRGVPASRLARIQVEDLGDMTVIEVRGDGEFAYSTFRLGEPERFVIDLPGVVNASDRSTVAVESMLVDRVRVAQFKPYPEPVSRVVVDMDGPAWPVVERTPDALIVRVRSLDSAAATGAAGDRMADAPPATRTPVPPPATETESDPPLVAEAEPLEDPAPAVPETEVADDDTMADDAMADEILADDGPADDEPVIADVSPATDSMDAEPMDAEPMDAEPMGSGPTDATEDEIPVRQVEADAPPTYTAEPVNGGDIASQPREERVVRREAPTAQEPPAAEEGRGPRIPTDRESMPTGGDTLVETGEIRLAASGPEAPGFAPRNLTGERQYTGAPIDMSLRDADVVETLRSFAKFSGLNMVIQPDVTGRVTVELTNVPWDQALEQILRINGLGYEVEGNILRIATLDTLAQEAENRQRLQNAQALSQPLQTVMMRLSYTNATNVAGILTAGGASGVLSPRGSVIVDQRTNTLIIKELPEYMDTVRSIIDNLDQPEPQVMIEARIIETTKRFSRTLGISWGFDAVASAATGNSTGLVFPNNVDASGGVNLIGGAANNGIIGLTLGNVLNTFQLDVLLQAAESDGLVNILSSPKVATLNNRQALIQSGVQVPIQTVANNTVTVQFVNATLRLEVTPQITADGTVVMDIYIQKREVQEAFLVAGAQNAPIATKEARTQVLVRDGGTAVIGGIYEISTDQGEDRVPGLANIPLIGNLFKNKRRTDENTELLIFITPRVVQL